MSWIVSAGLVSAGSILMVAGICYYMYRQYHENYMRSWATGLLLCFLGPVFILASALGFPKTLAFAGEHLAYLLSGFFLLKGIYIFLNLKKSKWLGYGVLLIAIWIAGGSAFRIPFPGYAMPTFLFVSFLLVRSGWVFIKSRHLVGTGGTVVGGAIVGWGLFVLSYPFLRLNVSFNTWGYLLSYLFTMSVAIGLLMMYFQKVRNDLTRSEECFRFMADNARDIIYRLRLVPELKFEFISSSVALITGFSAEAYYQNPHLAFDVIHPEYREQVKLIITGKSQHDQKHTFPCIHKQGQLYWLEENINPIVDQEGEVVFIEGIARDITERVNMEEQLRFLSMKDPLTDLYNRAYFEQQCRQLEDGKHDPMGMILCDIDGLKLVNDTLGHDAGDVLLRAAARVIRDSFRGDDIIARIGGDEFAVVLPDTSVANLEKAVTRLQSAIEYYNGLKKEYFLSMSIGFAARNNTALSINDLFKSADNNMYREKLYRSQSARSTVVNTLRKALEARDFITEGHAERLQVLVAELAVAAGFPENRLTDLKLLAQFHDLGKVGIPDRVLFKPGRLDPDERLEMQRHSEIGYRIAQASPDLLPLADWILKHHEWWNGEGYPLKLKGEEIPLECRLLAIVDAFDAMTNDRPYRKALSCEVALGELREGSGNQFDPCLVEQFIALLNQKRIA